MSRWKAMLFHLGCIAIKLWRGQPVRFHVEGLLREAKRERRK